MVCNASPQAQQNIQPNYGQTRSVLDWIGGWHILLIETNAERLNANTCILFALGPHHDHEGN